MAKTIDKLQQAVGEKQNSSYQAEPISRVPCLLGNRIKFIDLCEIEYVSTGPAGVQVNTADKEYYTEVTLKVLEERTPLLRCHKQHLVNVDTINEIVLLENNLARIETKTANTIPVSRRYLKIIKKKLLL